MSVSSQVGTVAVVSLFCVLIVASPVATIVTTAQPAGPTDGIEGSSASLDPPDSSVPAITTQGTQTIDPTGVTDSSQLKCTEYSQTRQTRRESLRVINATGQAEGALREFYSPSFWNEVSNEDIEQIKKELNPTPTQREAIISVLSAVSGVSVAVPQRLLQGIIITVEALSALNDRAKEELLNRGSGNKDLRDTLLKLEDNSEKINVCPENTEELMKERKRLLKNAYSETYRVSSSTEPLRNEPLINNAYAGIRDTTGRTFKTLQTDYVATVQWLKNSPANVSLARAVGLSATDADLGKLQIGDRRNTRINTFLKPNQHTIYKINNSTKLTGKKEVVAYLDTEDVEMYGRINEIPNPENPQRRHGLSEEGTRLDITPDGEFDSDDTVYILVRSETITQYVLQTGAGGPFNRTAIDAEVHSESSISRYPDPSISVTVDRSTVSPDESVEVTVTGKLTTSPADIQYVSVGVEGASADAIGNIQNGTLFTPGDSVGNRYGFNTTSIEYPLVEGSRRDVTPSSDPFELSFQLNPAKTEGTISLRAKSTARDGEVFISAPAAGTAPRDQQRESAKVTEIQLQPAVKADAGENQSVTAQSTVILDATKSTNTGDDALTYEWTQLSGPSVSLTDASTATPEFTAPEIETSATLTFEVTVSDEEFTDTDRVNVTIKPENRLPIASATFENQTVPGGTQNVTIESAQFGNESIPGEEFVIVVHTTTNGRYGSEIGPKVGESAVLSAGAHTDITVDLSTTLGSGDSIAELASSQSLVAMLHRANTTDGDEITHGSQIRRDGDAVTSRAQVKIRQPPASVRFENQTLPSGSPSVMIESAQFGNKSVPGEEFVVVVHETTDGRYGSELGAKIGESDVLSTGAHRNITVDLAITLGPSDSIARLINSQSLVAMLHRANTTASDNGEFNYGPTVTRDEDEVTSRAQVTTSPTLFDVPVSELPGDGNESDPYEISDIFELQAMEDDLDANYELVSDIDVSLTVRANNVRGFDPVGNGQYERFQFTGSFDGNHHTITGLRINQTTDGVYTAAGMFGVTGSGATITNVTLRDLTVTGGRRVGGLVGFNTGGTITNVTVSGNVTGNTSVGGVIGQNAGTIQNTAASVGVTSKDGFGGVGGLVGSNGQYGDGGIIQNVTASGDVTGRQFVGGLIGYNDNTVKNALASGSVNGSEEVGGLVGRNYRLSGLIQNASASGSVTGESEVGGLVGSNFVGAATTQNAKASGNVTGDTNVGGLAGFNGGTVQSALASGSVNGSEEVGGLVGSNTETVEQSYFDTEATGQSTSAGSATGLTTAQMQGQTAAENMDGFDFETTWTTTSGYPALRALPDRKEDSGGGDGDGDGDGDDLLPPASVTFDNQTVLNGSETVTVDSAQFGSESVPGEEFVIVVHTTTNGRYGSEIGPKVGESDVLSAGTHTDITVDLNTTVGSSDSLTTLTENQTLVAMLHRADTTDTDDIVHAAPIPRDGTDTPVFDQAEITVEQQGNSIDVTRTVSATEVTPSEQVTLTTIITGVSGGVSITSSYDPQVASATVQSVTVNGASTNPIIATADKESVVTLGDGDVGTGTGTDATVRITEELTVGEETDVTHSITGNVTAGETTTEVDPVSVTVAEQSVVDEYMTQIMMGPSASLNSESQAQTSLAGSSRSLNWGESGLNSPHNRLRDSELATRRELLVVVIVLALAHHRSQELCEWSPIHDFSFHPS